MHTAERDHFTPRPLSYFQTMYDALSAEDPGRISLWLAHHEGDLVAATIAIRVGAHAWYSYGASSTEKRDVRGSNAVQWAMIRDALAQGADVYDLRGITDTLDADDPHVGLIQFKVGTGGEAVEYVGEWDLPLNRALYAAFELYMNRRSPRGARMSLTLTVDGDRWRQHLRRVADDNPGLMPVAKGNGYGFGLGRLARKAEWLGVDTLAVGTYEELPEVVQRFAGDLLGDDPVASDRTGAPRGAPARPGHPHRRAGWPTWSCCSTATRQARIVLERLTCMRRHGMSAEELRAAARLLERRPAHLEGVALHLPLASGAHLAEVVHLMNDVVAAELPTRTSVAQPPHRRPSSPRCAPRTPTSTSALGSAPTSGSAIATRSR